MAEEKVVLSDASPLIGLAAANAFQLLRHLFGSISVTESVRKEVDAGKGLPGALDVRRGVAAGWIRRITDPRGGQLFATLGAGEASTLNAALALGPHRLLLSMPSVDRLRTLRGSCAALWRLAQAGRRKVHHITERWQSG